MYSFFLFLYIYIYYITIMKNLSEFILEAKPNELGINGNVNEIIDKLKEAFAEEMNAWYQYYIIAPFLVGNERTNIAADYKENGKEELKHANMLLERINELNGTFTDIDTPDSWNKIAPHKFILQESPDVAVSVGLMADAERGAIETYTALEKLTRGKDVVTNKMIKGILADEQKHLQEMLEFLEDIK